MSGGSFEYLCHAFPEDLLGGEKHEELERMINALAATGYAQDAATETATFVAEIRAARARAEAHVVRLHAVWKAMEWWKSGDWSEDQFREALSEYRGISS